MSADLTGQIRSSEQIIGAETQHSLEAEQDRAVRREEHNKLQYRQISFRPVVFGRHSLRRPATDSHSHIAGKDRGCNTATPHTACLALTYLSGLTRRSCTAGWLLLWRLRWLLLHRLSLSCLRCRHSGLVTAKPHTKESVHSTTLHSVAAHAAQW